LTGANGTLILDGDALAAIDLKDARDDERPSRASTATVSAASPVVADASAHVRVFQDFLDAIAERRPPCCDGPGGRQSVALINAVYESARLDRPVALT